MKNKSEVIETTNCYIYLGEDEIMRLITKPNTHSVLETSMEEVEAMKYLTKGRRVPLFSDIRNMLSVSPETRTYTNSEEVVGSFTAVGMLVGNVFSRVIGSFIVGINRPSYPVRLFTDEDKALEWLKRYRNP
ncbi:MAG: hypothetical protein KDD99_14035 [Bacteroidetes bacterium]|nr:hypothetical protein [Bacteroidota bacterium]